MPFQSTDPFSSARLKYRAIELPQDNAVFSAINSDRIGYVNSNANNIRLSKQSDAENFAKSCSECFLGTIITLNHEEAKKLGGLHQEKQEKDRDGIAIGQVKLDSIRSSMMQHRRTEIGIDILPEYQGRGYGREAIEWALDYAFRRAGLHSVRIRAFEWNEGAIRLYERLGFRHEGRENEALWHEGRWWDGIEMAMLDREWWELEHQREKSKEIK